MKSVSIGGWAGTSTLLLLAATSCAMCGCQQWRAHTPSWNLFTRPVASQAPTRSALPELSKREQQQARFALARSVEQAHQLEDAAAAYEAVLQANSKHPAASHRLAVVYDKLGRFDEAEPRYRQALKLDPKNAELLCDFGYSLYLRGNWEEAERHLTHAVAQQPQFARAHNNLALIQARTGRVQESLKSFQMSGVSPSQAHANVAFALMLDQRWQEAQRVLQTAAAIDPGSTLIRQRSDELQSIWAQASTPPAEIQPPQYAVPSLPPAFPSDQVFERSRANVRPTAHYASGATE